MRSAAARSCATLALVAAVAACTAGSSPAKKPAPTTAARALVRTPPVAADWPSYGDGPQHTFAGHTTLSPASVSSLRPAWRFATGDAVTATPTVVAGVVYVGSWDGNFYAIDLHSGALRWQFALHPQPAVSPQPGRIPRDGTSDGGMVTSSAWFEPGDGRTRPDLVIFGGGYTLYALDAHTGQQYWWHDYTGRPELPADPAHDETRMFSSPVVADGKVIVGVTPDGQRGRRGYIVAADLDTGRPVWVFETDAGPDGQVRNDGCGGVWSSGTVLPSLDAVVFDVSDCHFANPPPSSESILALRASDGQVLWSYQPPRPDPHCDLDFGATANAGLGPAGTVAFLGVGGKDGSYYSLDPQTGAPRWSTNVVFGGFSGGFIGTTAYDGTRVLGSTALGDFGRFERGTNVLCDAANPRDTGMQEPSAHAFAAATGTVLWQGTQSPSFAPTTVAGGMTFNGVALSAVIDVRDAASGTLLTQVTLPALCWSGIATVGDALVLGTGAAQQGSPDGVIVLTPGGQPPST